MTSKRSPQTLRQIERDLIAEKPLNIVLQKLILLGGNTESPELREWAASELRGYPNRDQLPAYRYVSAPLQIDGTVPGGIVRHETISTMDLPDFAQDDLDETVPLQMGVREIQSMIEQHRDKKIVKLQPHGVSLLVRYMNSQGHYGRINALYWSVSTIALERSWIRFAQGWPSSSRNCPLQPAEAKHSRRLSRRRTR